MSESRKPLPALDGRSLMPRRPDTFDRKLAAYRKARAMTDPTRVAAIRWEDLPPKPWAPETEPPAEQLAEWLTSLTPEHLAWLLGQQRLTWQQDSRCFTENHPGYIRHLESLVCELQERLSAARRAGDQR